MSATTSRRRFESYVVVGCGALAVLALLIRIPAVAEPLGIDQGLWASVAKGLSRGQALYVDLWDQKPPGIFLAYLAAFTLLGWTTATVAWLDIAAAGATTWLVYAVTRQLTTVATGAAAAALYAVLTVPSWLYGHGGFLERSVNETFIALFVATAAWCAVRYVTGSAGRGALLWCGVAAGSAAVFKPNAAIYVIALGVWMTFAVRTLGRGRRLGARELAVLAGGAFAVPLALAIWLWSHGILREAWIASIEYNLWYVGGPEGANHPLEYAKAIWLRLKTDPLWASGGIGVLVLAAETWRRKRIDPLPALAVAWGSGAAIAIYANGAWLFNAYFIQALPPLAILGAWLLAIPRGAVLHRGGAVATAAVMVFLLVSRGYVGRVADSTLADLDMLFNRAGRTAYLERFGVYGGNSGYAARANDELATYISRRTTVADRIYIFGINAAEAYFVTDRLPAQRMLRVNFFLPGGYPDSRYQLEAVLNDLAAAPPAYLVFERLHTTSPVGVANDELLQRADVRRLLGNYRFEGQIEDFAVYRRVD